MSLKSRTEFERAAPDAPDPTDSRVDGQSLSGQTHAFKPSARRLPSPRSRPKLSTRNLSSRVAWVRPPTRHEAEQLVNVPEAVVSIFGILRLCKIKKGTRRHRQQSSHTAKFFQEPKRSQCREFHGDVTNSETVKLIPITLPLQVGKRHSWAFYRQSHL